MATIDVVDAHGATIAIEKPLVPGRTAAATSRPVALSTEDLALLTSIDTRLTTLAGFVDGLEGLIGTTNTALTTLQGYVDGLEALEAAARPASQSGAWSVAINTALPAGAALIGKAGIDQTTPGTTNAVAIAAAAGTRVEGTITTGGTAQNIFSATPTNGFEVINVHASATLYIRENGTATVADNSFNTPIPPRMAYVSPVGFKPTGDVSVIAAATSHAFIARRW